jgi:hypothetical protein
VQLYSEKAGIEAMGDKGEIMPTSERIETASE